MQAREAELQAAFVEVFGISPADHVRDAARTWPTRILVDDDEDQPRSTAEDAIARLKAELGAEPEA